MKTKLNLLAAGIFLAALGTGFGQSTLQFSASHLHRGRKRRRGDAHWSSE